MSMCETRPSPENDQLSLTLVDRGLTLIQWWRCVKIRHANNKVLPNLSQKRRSYLSSSMQLSLVPGKRLKCSLTGSRRAPVHKLVLNAKVENIPSIADESKMPSETSDSTSHLAWAASLLSKAWGHKSKRNMQQIWTILQYNRDEYGI